MMTTASASANEEDEYGVLDRVGVDTNASTENEMGNYTSTGDAPNLIAPSPHTDEEQLIIPPGDAMEHGDVVSSGDNAFATGLILTIGLSGFAGLIAALIIFKNKN